MTHALHQGHVLDVLPTLTEGSVRTCVTSPPYWGLRDYGLPPTTWPELFYAPMPGLPEIYVDAWDGCLGLEPDPFAFVAHLVAVFREVRRVLAEDGTLWLNLGDTWTSGSRCWRASDPKNPARAMEPGERPLTPEGLKPKDLLGIPWRVAMALQADGWFLRSEVIWHKPNPMPESVRDRVTKAHEQVFLLSKSERYFYDADAIAEPAVFGSRGSHFHTGKTVAGREHIRPVGKGPRNTDSETRNKRSVWTIPTQPFGGAHFATMPSELARLCIRAGSAPGDVVLDPFSGAGTTGLVASREGRGFVGAELSEDYCRIARERWRAEAPLLMWTRAVIAALYVATGGCYFGLPDVDPWDEKRDARLYVGPWPVVAHPPCQRWGRYWFGGPSAKVRRVRGDDGGCFAAALAAVRKWGGVLEHPEASSAWKTFGLLEPPRSGGWVVADFEGGWTCCVEQGHYGHRARKATWLYAVGVRPLPALRWGPSISEARLDQGFHSAEERARYRATLRNRSTPPGERTWARNQYEKMTGRKHFARLGKRELAATPLPFRDLLLDLARSVRT